MTDAQPRRKSKRQRIAEKSDGRCWYCSCELGPDTRTYDHVVPKASGGPSTEENLVLACAICNGNKRNMSLDQYREQLGGIKFFGETVSDRRGRPRYINDPRHMAPPSGAGQRPK